MRRHFNEVTLTKRHPQAAMTPEQRTVEFLRRAMRNNSHWRPSLAMAKCLSLAPAKLTLTANKEDATNLVWVTVLVLIYCTTQLSDLHELWYELADAANAWLYDQPHFVENREDLVHSACSQLNVRDVSALLSSLFPEPKDADTLALEAALGDWKICYLDEPPYTMYYWNEKTNLSTWKNPIETAKMQQELLEKRKKREELLAKVLPMRVRIDRDAMSAPRKRFCGYCVQAPPKEAVVMCLSCDSTFFCEECCDDEHSKRDKIAHIETSFRFYACIGVKGFPREKNGFIL